MSPATTICRRGSASLLLAPLLGVLALISFAAPAQAADGATISHVQTTDTGVEVLVSVPPNSVVDLPKVSVTIGGVDTDATAVRAGSSGAVRRTAVIAIDTSNSMRGARFAAAQAAARTFLAQVPDDVYVGVVGFSSSVDTLVAPTLDHGTASTAIDDLTLSRGTRLYDGVIAADQLAGTDGQRKLLVLSDGADTSKTPLSAAVSAIKKSASLVDVIALDSGTANSDLAALAKAGQGAVLPATSAALGSAFAGEAEALDRQLLVTAATPTSLGKTDANIVVTLPTKAGTTLTASAFAKVAASAPAVGAITVPVIGGDRGWALPSWSAYVGVGVLGAALITLLMLLVPRPATVDLADRVTTYTSSIGEEGPAHSAGPRIDTDQALTQAKDAAAEMLRRNRSLEARIAARLDAAGSELKSAEWLLLHAAIFIVCALLGLLALTANVLIGLLLILGGAIIPWFSLGFRAGRRRKQFNQMLPDTLQLMSGALAAGLSLAQAVDTIVREGSEPVSSAFRRVLVETRLGVSVEDALDAVAERFESKDFEWAVMAIRIQRQVGGNLAELLDTVAATMREREYLRRQVLSLSAEGRLSAWVLGLLPPLFLLYLTLTQGSYVQPLFHDPRGWIMLFGASLWLGIGVFWMSRMVKVEV